MDFAIIIFIIIILVVLRENKIVLNIYLIRRICLGGYEEGGREWSIEIYGNKNRK